MKYSASLLLLASAGWASALTRRCADEGGNWFCNQVNHIRYEGIGGKGSFKDVTGMGSNGECQMTDKSYDGPLAPFDEDLSIHIRGPFQLKEAAVYNLAPKNGRDTEVPRRVRPRQVHEPQKKADVVVATIDGKVVSWENNWFGGSPTKAPAPVATPPAHPPPAYPPPAYPPTNPGPSGSAWNRVAYYNAEKKVVENMVFLGNYGGQGSGVFDYTWGNSLAYLNADGNGGSSSPQTLKDVNIPSNKEFSIFSAEKCDGSCGFSRAKDVAYKGFGGANKVFLFHFKMPLDGDRGFNGDMPALWALNARIPRSAQYNACSCWKTGCGEADIYEVLAKGDTKCKSTLHMAKGTGSSDFFKRPVDKFIKVATVFHEATGSISIQLLPDNTDFSKGLDDATVRGWINGQ
ncbi:Protein TOS1 [Tolypocladium paradoxum]|uniref:glucan endo-1,3-beta-D-glucosidase n=1 Tax=Tolypocladium paradoxum TaxID=94208 RepID=A0A2S4KRB4_9HYPO|nr:Protein TOS1 [Tolypocladium paradoxum]